MLVRVSGDKRAVSLLRQRRSVCVGSSYTVRSVLFVYLSLFLSCCCFCFLCPPSPVASLVQILHTSFGPSLRPLRGIFHHSPLQRTIGTEAHQFEASRVKTQHFETSAQKHTREIQRLLEIHGLFEQGNQETHTCRTRANTRSNGHSHPTTGASEARTVPWCFDDHQLFSTSQDNDDSSLSDRGVVGEGFLEWAADFVEKRASKLDCKPRAQRLLPGGDRKRHDIPEKLSFNDPKSCRSSVLTVSSHSTASSSGVTRVSSTASSSGVGQGSFSSLSTCSHDDRLPTLSRSETSKKRRNGPVRRFNRIV